MKSRFPAFNRSISLLLIALPVTPVSAQGMAQSADRLAIAEAIAQYSYTLDFPDADAYAALYTEDAVWEAFIRDADEAILRLESKEAIRTWAENRAAGLEGRKSGHHQSGLTFLELTADSARTQNMLLLTYQGADETAPTVTGSGIYYDTWRKTADGWRIVSRVLRIDGPLP